LYGAPPGRGRTASVNCTLPGSFPSASTTRCSAQRPPPEHPTAVFPVSLLYPPVTAAGRAGERRPPTCAAFASRAALA
jgi:hypothetical protein